MGLIDSDALMHAIYHRAFEMDGDTMWQSGCWVRYRAVEQVVNEQPTIEQERPTGHWIVVDRPIETSAICECSQCKHRVWKYEGENVVDIWRFCPKCGAKMEG